MTSFWKQWNAKVKAQRGYSLVELSVSTSILAILAVGGLAVMQKKTSADKINDTSAKLATIESAIKGFVRVKGYLPCPALPGLIESDANFGKSEDLTLVDGVITSETIYDDKTDDNATGTDTCSNNGLENGTGAVPVRTLNLGDDYAYDGWGRKFTYRIADSAGAKADFQDVAFKGNIRIVDLSGTNKTNIDNPPPYNDGAIYVIISHGSNGKDVAWRRNFDYTDASASELPQQATGVEGQNTNHVRNSYVQDNKTEKFDDIVIFGSRRVLIPPKQVAAPASLDDQTCASAKALYQNPTVLQDFNALAATDVSDATKATAKAVGDSAKQLAYLCMNAPTGGTVSNSPTSIAGMMLWLDATDPHADNSLLADGTKIAVWNDKSGHNNNATTQSPSESPTYKTSAMNGKAVMSFDGTTNFFRLGTADSNPPDKISIFAVVRPGPTTATADALTEQPALYSTIGLGGAGGVPTNSWQIGFANAAGVSNAFRVASSSGWNYASANDTIAAGTSYLINYVRVDGNGAMFQKVYINGTEVLLGAPQTVFDQGSNTQKLIGRGYSASTSEVFFKGYMGEFIIINRPLPDRDRLGLQTYLANKWGLTITATATTNCPYEGQTWRTTANDPVGGCHCDDGYEVALNLESTNACHYNDTTFGKCVPVGTQPNYDEYGANNPSRSNMRLWLDANDCTTIMLKAAVAAGEAKHVSEWHDKGPDTQVFHNAHVESTTLPFYVAPGSGDGNINGKAVIRFPGVAYLEELTSNTLAMAGEKGMTIYAVITPASGGADTQAIIGRDSAVSPLSAGWLATLTKDVNNKPLLGRLSISTSATAYGYQYGLTSLHIGTPQILTFTYNGDPDNDVATNQGEVNVYVNGLLDSSVAALPKPQNSVISNGPPAHIGNTSDGSDFFTGDIAELIVYDEYKPTSLRRLVEENYLSHKWGITLGSETPAPGNPPVNEGLQLWLDASNVNSLYSDDDCTVNVSANYTGPIACWKSNRNNLTAKHVDAAFGNRPNYFYSNDGTADIPSGTGTLVFDGLDDALQITTGIDAAAPIMSFAGDSTVVAVVKSFNTSSGVSPAFLSKRPLKTDSILGGFALGHTAASGRPYMLVTGSGAPADTYYQGLNSTFFMTNQYLIFAVVNTPTETRFYKNGILTDTMPHGVYDSPVTTNSYPINIGVQNMPSGSETNYWKGTIAEILAYNRALSAEGATSDLMRLETALANKWQLTMGEFIHPGTPDSSNPAGRPPLKLWLDASDINATGTSPAGGTSVANWADKSGFNNSAIQTTAGSRPTVNLVNGKTAVFFDGVDDSLKLNTTLNYYVSTDMATIFVAMKSVKPTGSPYTLLGLYGNGSVKTGFNGSQVFSAPLYGTPTPPGASVTAPSSFYTSNYSALFRIAFKQSIGAANPGSLLVNINGTAQNNSTTISTNVPYNGGSLYAFKTDVIGSNNNVSSDFFKGNIYEIIVYNSYLDNTTNLAKDTECYLNYKWFLLTNTIHPGYANCLDK